MAKRTFLAGVTSQTVDIFIQDSSSTVGAGLAALAFGTTGLKCYYRKGATGTPTAVTLATQTVGGAWSSGGFVELDATNMKGAYRFDIPDTVLASTPFATLYFYGAANMAPVMAELEIVSYNPFDSVRLGLTALPNAAAEAAGGLYTRGSGAGQITQDANGRVDVNVKALLGTAWLTPGTAGTPDVNVKLWNGLTTVALPLIPTTAGRTLDVSATGEAGVDWANVGSPTTTLALTGTTIASTQKVDLETIKTNPVVNAGTVTFPTTATLASTTNITAGTITTVTNLTNAPTAGDLTATMKTSVQTASDAAITANATIIEIESETDQIATGVTLSAGDSPVMQSGTATAGGAATITIQTALGADSLPVGSLIKITSGTGVNQARVIIGYVNSTKVVTVDRNWVTNPDNTSIYSILYNELPALSSGLKITDVALVDTLTTYTGNTPQTGDSFARLGVAGVGLTNLGDTRIAHLDADVSSRMATYTQPIGFLSATFPSGTVANTTNITAGTITTVTNLTNAATAGDLTATMKTSVQTASDAAVTANTTIVEINADVDEIITSVAAIPTTSVTTAHFDTIIGTPVVSVSADIAEIEGETDGIANLVTTSYFDTIIGTPVVSVSGDIAEVEGETDTLLAGVTVTTNTDKTGYALSATGLDPVVLTELSAVPSPTAKIVDAVCWLYMALRNLRATTATQDTVTNTANTVIGTATVSDDGTTFTKTKYT